MLARGQDVVPDQPVTGDDLVEPGEPPFVGVAAVAVLVEDLLYVRGSLDFSGGRFCRDGWAYQLQQGEHNHSCKDQLGKG